MIKGIKEAQGRLREAQGTEKGTERHNFHVGSRSHPNTSPLETKQECGVAGAKRKEARNSTGSKKMKEIYGNPQNQNQFSDQAIKRRESAAEDPRNQFGVSTNHKMQLTKGDDRRIKQTKHKTKHRKENKHKTQWLRTYLKKNVLIYLGPLSRETSKPKSSSYLQHSQYLQSPRAEGSITGLQFLKPISQTSHIVKTIFEID